MFSAYFYPEYSGAALQGLRLAKELKGQGNHVEFLTIQRKGLPRHERVEGFDLWRIEQGHGSKHKELRLWINMLLFVWKRRNDFDIIHSHGAYYTNSIIGPIGKLTGLKSLVKASLAGDDLHNLRKSMAGRLHHLFLRYVDACIAISRDLEIEFLNGDLPRNKIHYLPNGVDTDLFHPPTQEEKRNLRLQLDLPVDQSIILYVGVLDQRKNIAWLVEQWIEHRGFSSGAILLVVGPKSREDSDGSLYSRIQNLSVSHPELLKLHEFTSDISRYYKSATILALPSHKEGLPNVVLEAMASGLPCITARSSGSRELIEEGVTGYTYEPNYAEEFASALGSCLANGPEILGAKARERMLACFSIREITSRYLDVYKQITNN